MPTLKTRYFLPTPVFWRKIGDAMLTISVAISATAALTAYPWISASASVLGLLGKVVTNFFTDVKEDTGE